MKGEDELFNFGFTVLHSPFGESYFRAIQKKLFEDTTDGVFIVAVDSWSLCSFKLDPNDQSLMQENNLFIGKLSYFSGWMNFEYIFNYYINSYYEILLRYFANNSLTLTDDGWLKATPFLKEEWIKPILESKLREYKSRAENVSFSEYRYNNFLELLNYLKEKGSVYVIVMPVDQKIYEIEMELLPDMVNQIDKFCSSNAIPFRDFNNSDVTFKFNDGVHLHYKSSLAFSDDLANWILEVENNN
ncbi:hypothetical protein [Cyclobacterium plantarum]|uniref:hypothetical protein n=1 Tax=Cyclobacterium plantarum TaxID=2716263 RepID=UPI003F7121F0